MKRTLINYLGLLAVASMLMMLAGVIFCFIQQWIYAVLLWVGAFNCMVAALNFKNRKDKLDCDK